MSEVLINASLLMHALFSGATVLHALREDSVRPLGMVAVTVWALLAVAAPIVKFVNDVKEGA